MIKSGHKLLVFEEVHTFSVNIFTISKISYHLGILIFLLYRYFKISAKVCIDKYGFEIYWIKLYVAETHTPRGTLGSNIIRTHTLKIFILFHETGLG